MNHVRCHDIPDVASMNHIFFPNWKPDERKLVLAMIIIYIVLCWVRFWSSYSNWHNVRMSKFVGWRKFDSLQNDFRMPSQNLVFPSLMNLYPSLVSHKFNLSVSIAMDCVAANDIAKPKFFPSQKLWPTQTFESQNTASHCFLFFVMLYELAKTVRSLFDLLFLPKQ